MIVTCPNCETKYNLPEDKLSPEGTKVKCSKCGHVFKATPPPQTPEEEVEVLLDDQTPSQAPQDESLNFDMEFEAAASGDEDVDGGLDDLLAQDEPAATDPVAPPPSDDGFGEDFDDDFGEEEFEDDGFGDEFKDDDDVFEDDSDDFGDDGFGEPVTPASAAPEAAEDGFGDAMGDDFQEEGFEDDGFESEDDDDPYTRESGLFNALGDEDESLDLDSPRKRKKGRPFLLLFLTLILVLGGAIATFHFKMWSLPDSMKKYSFELPFELPFSVPFIKAPDAPEAPEPGESPMERIKSIQPVDFRQYIITNEKVGPIFVVEGKALNRFTSPKERIKVEVTLFDIDGKVLATREQLCGNTLSLFQLQVQTREEIVESLESKAGIYANNTYIKPGETTPFMVVFFDPPENVEEYLIKIVDARDPER